MKKIISVVGARPNFMKVAPIYRAINEYNQSNNLSSELARPLAGALSQTKGDQTISQSDVSTLSNLEFVISPEGCRWHNLKLADEVIAIDPNYYRPTEAKQMLDWKAETKLGELVRKMAESDFKKVIEKGY